MIRSPGAQEATSALIVAVPEAEPHVADLRQRYDPSAPLGAPAHVTVLYPFLPPHRITTSVLDGVRSAISTIAPFRFRLARVGRFPETVYLAPEPPDPFAELTTSVHRQFPDYPPYGGQFDSIIPHLTVAHAEEAVLATVERQLLGAITAAGGLAAACNELSLIENSSGAWRPMASIPLGSGRP